MSFLVILLSLLSCALSEEQAAAQNSPTVPPHLEDRKVSISIDVADESDAEAQPYFATFDATNLAMQWQRMAASYDVAVEHKMIKETPEPAPVVEASQVQSSSSSSSSSSKSNSQQPQSASSSSPSQPAATVDPSQRVAEQLQAALDFKLKKQQEDNVAIVSMEQEQERRKTHARQVFASSKLFRELVPHNVMYYIHRHLPFAVFVLCDCARDYEFAMALEELEGLMVAQGYANQLTPLFIYPEATKRFQLDLVFSLGEEVATMFGDSAVQTKTVLIPFGRELASAPATVHCEIFDECCGDKFEVSVGEATTKGFHLTIKRTDKEEGWGQFLKIKWKITPTLHPHPAFILDNIPQGSNNEKMIYRPDDYESSLSRANQLNTFMQRFFASTLPLLVRSQPIPISPPHDRSPGKVVDVVGANFREIVLDRTKDVFLLIYSPWCGASIAVQPLFEQTAADLKDEKTVVIARIDKTANDLPVRGIPVMFYPTAFLFPACEFGSAGCPILDFNDFNGSKTPHNKDVPHSHYTREGMAAFVREHGFTFLGMVHQSSLDSNQQAHDTTTHATH